MPQFVHLHVHTQYSILDGQASIQRLVDKAMADGQPGIAVTDHGDMFGIKEFYNYVQKVKGKCKDKAAEAEARIAALRDGTETCADPAAEIAKCERQLEECRRKLAFKPIIGCEVYVARRRLHDKEGKPDQSGYHLILLAKNLKGYHNLIKIVSKAWTEGFYMRPRTDRTEIEKYHEGLICCSACLAGEVPRAITANDLEKAEESIRWHKKVFGDDYYLELQLHKATVERANHEAYPMQLHVNKHLRQLAAKHNVRMVCTNDVHFVDEDNAEAHDRLICLSTGKDLDDPKRMLYSKQEWLKTTAEMAAIFGQTDPEAMSTTVDICNQIECYSIDHAPIMPNFEIPEEFGTEAEYRARLTEKDLFDEFTRDENGNVVMSEEEGLKKIQKLGGYDKLYRIKFEADYLAKLTMDGAHRRYGEQLTEEQEERLKFELHIMKTMGFPGYFLIVQDFIRAAREELDVSVGPGRGSAAGSAVAYCLGITQIDPIAYDLLFERFLNPDRISLPDIDVDFDDDGRGRVLNWVTQKYGKEKVAHIITYGTMATKLAIKDVARVQKLMLSESDRLCKLVPDKIPDKKLNLQNAIDYVPELKAAEQSDNPILRDTIRYAKMLEGNVRNTGVQADDVLFYTKKIGSGIMNSAYRAGFETPESMREVLDSMMELNKAGAAAMKAVHVHAATDVTGFGLAGHLHEMLAGSGLAARLFWDDLPLFDGVYQYSVDGCRPGRSFNLVEWGKAFVKQGTMDDATYDNRMGVLLDPQTSGGLLVAVAPDEADAFAAAFEEETGRAPSIVGRAMDGPAGFIFVR